MLLKKLRPVIKKVESPYKEYKEYPRNRKTVIILVIEEIENFSSR